MKRQRIVFTIAALVIGIGSALGYKSDWGKKSKRIPPYYVYTMSGGSYHLYTRCCYEPNKSGCGATDNDNYYYSNGSQLIRLNRGTKLTFCPTALINNKP